MSDIPPLLVVEHINGGLGCALCTLRVHAGHNPAINNVVIIPNTFRPYIYTNHVSAVLHRDVAYVIAYTQHRAFLHARQSMALSTTEVRP
jgi:hypothetical protein